MKDPRQPVSALDFQDPLQFWDILSEVMNENPPPADQVTGLVPMYRPLGLEPGKTWDRTKVHPIVLESMRRAAQDIGPMLNNLPAGRFADGWFWPPPTLGNFGTDFQVRAITARIGLTANTPREAVYLMAKLDQDLRSDDRGRALHPDVRPKPPPYVAPGFWSLTMYDGRNNYTVPNPIGRYALGSDDRLEANDDGSRDDLPPAREPRPGPRGQLAAGPRGAVLRDPPGLCAGRAIVEALERPGAYRPPVVKAVK